MKLEVIAWNESRPPREQELRARLEKEGFSVWSWTDRPGADYQPHTHEHDESIWLLEGEITFGVAGAEYAVKPGDRLMLPSGTVHTAIAGREGATYLVGERQPRAE